MNLARTESIAEARHEQALSRESRAAACCEAYADEHELLSRAAYDRLCVAPTGLDMQCAIEFWLQAEGTILSCAWTGDEANRDARLGFAVRTLLATAFGKMADNKADELMTAAEKAAERGGK